MEAVYIRVNIELSINGFKTAATGAAVNQHVGQPMRNDTCRNRAIYSFLRVWPHLDCLADDNLILLCSCSVWSLHFCPQSTKLKFQNR